MALVRNQSLSFFWGAISFYSVSWLCYNLGMINEFHWIPKWILFSTVLGRYRIPNQGGTSWLVTGEFERCRIISPMYHLHRTWDTWSSEGSGLSKIFRSFKRLAAGVSGPQSLMLIWYMDFGPVPFRNRFCEYLIIVWLSFRLSFYWASISGNIAKYWKTATKKYRTFKQIFAFTSRSGEGTCFPRSTWNPRSTFPGYRFWGGHIVFHAFLYLIRHFGPSILNSITGILTVAHMPFSVQPGPWVTPK